MNYKVDFELNFKRNSFPGKFFALEGLDGSGKTIQAKLLAENLIKSGKNVFLTKNPTDGEIGKFIRQILQGKISVPSVAFQYLFSADRQTQQSEIIKHLQKGETVISDRYFWSSVAYGLADKEDADYKNTLMLELISQSLLSMYNQFLIPDKTFYLEVSVETGLSRRHDSNKERELYENIEKMEKAQKGYKWLLQEFPKEFIIIDGEKTVEETQDSILSKMR